MPDLLVTIMSTKFQGVLHRSKNCELYVALSNESDLKSAEVLIALMSLKDVISLLVDDGVLYPSMLGINHQVSKLLCTTP